VRRFLRVLDGRVAGAAAESEWERKVYDRLSQRGVGGMVRQFKVRLPDYGPARFDVAIPDVRWALEIDVHPEHRTVEGAARDNRRDDAADAIGWFVRRISEAQLTDHFESTIDAVVASIARRRQAMS
jgi:very-short-patch-repair endonuclease